MAEKSSGPGRRTLPATGATQYLEAETGADIRLSVHSSSMLPGTLVVVGTNRRGDYRPLRLDEAGVRLLRDALDLALEDLANQPPSGA